MKKIRYCFVLAGLLCCTVLSAQEGLSAAEFEKRISVQQVQLLDVRTAGEFQTSHLKNALQADWLKKEQFADRVQYLDKTKPVLVYCASGIRSAAAAKWLQENGFTSVQNLNGGINAWKKEGKPVDVTNAITQLTVENYTALTSSATITLIEFGAPWCPPCRQMQPVLQQLQKDLAGKFKLVQVDADAAVEIMKAQAIDFIPAFIVYKNGKEAWRKSGVAELAELKAHLK